MRIEHKIGEVYKEKNGTKHVCVADIKPMASCVDDCSMYKKCMCVFYKKPESQLFACRSDEREDKQSIHYELVENFKKKEQTMSRHKGTRNVVETSIDMSRKNDMRWVKHVNNGFAEWDKK
jgi:hypothetical protein